MDPFSYICVLTSIVAGLAVTRLVSGFGQLLQTRARTPPYWVHALWMVNVLLTMIITWWLQYRWRNAPHWTLFLFLWLLVAPLILYLHTTITRRSTKKLARAVRGSCVHKMAELQWSAHYGANSWRMLSFASSTAAKTTLRVNMLAPQKLIASVSTWFTSVRVSCFPLGNHPRVPSLGRFVKRKSCGADGKRTMGESSSMIECSCGGTEAKSV